MWLLFAITELFIYLFIHNCLCVLGEYKTPHSFPLDLFLYVNLGAKGAQKLTVLGIPHFC